MKTEHVALLPALLVAVRVHVCESFGKLLLLEPFAGVTLPLPNDPPHSYLRLSLAVFTDAQVDVNSVFTAPLAGDIETLHHGSLDPAGGGGGGVSPDCVNFKLQMACPVPSAPLLAHWV